MLSEIESILASAEKLAQNNPIEFIGLILFFMVLFIIVIPGITTANDTSRDRTHSGKYLHGRMIK